MPDHKRQDEALDKYITRQMRNALNESHYKGMREGVKRYATQPRANGKWFVGSRNTTLKEALAEIDKEEEAKQPTPKDSPFDRKESGHKPTIYINVPTTKKTVT